LTDFCLRDADIRRAYSKAFETTLARL